LPPNSLENPNIKEVNENSHSFLSNRMVKVEKTLFFLGELFFFIDETDLGEIRMDEESPSLHSYFNKPGYSDLMFKFEKAELYCNKMLLATYSLKFRNLLSDGEIKIIKISDVNYSTLYILFEQFYHVKFLFQKA
jgi:BTB/POZ domain